MTRKKWIKASLAISACLFILWWALGTGATLAWFSDVDEVRNEFRVGLLKMDVEYKNDIITEYTPLQDATKVFTDEALYEPGYTQVVYLRIHNKGDMPFNYKLAVTVKSETEPTNLLGQKFRLSNHLYFGTVFAKTEAELQQEVADRLEARTHAVNTPLNTWSEDSPYVFAAGEDPHYAALIIYMPEEVDNVANYRGAIQPRIELGITVFAQQIVD